MSIINIRRDVTDQFERYKMPKVGPLLLRNVGPAVGKSLPAQMRNVAASLPSVSCNQTLTQRPPNLVDFKNWGQRKWHQNCHCEHVGYRQSSGSTAHVPHQVFWLRVGSPNERRRCVGPIHCEWSSWCWETAGNLLTATIATVYSNWI